MDDNNRVRTGDLLVQLDKEPYQVQVNIAQAALDAAQADLLAAEAQTRGVEGQARSLRFNLDHAIEDVNNQVSLLRSRVAGLDSYKAAVAKAQADYDRACRSSSREHHRRGARSPQAGAARRAGPARGGDAGHLPDSVSLGLPPNRRPGTTWRKSPRPGPDLLHGAGGPNEADSGGRATGHPISFNKSPKEMIADFYKREPG